MQLIKKYRRIWLPMLLVALLAFGTAVTGLASETSWPVELTHKDDDFDSGDFGAPDPSCEWLVEEYGFPEDCDLMGVKIDDPITGSFDDQTGSIKWGCDATDFDVELTVDGNTFDFEYSGYTVYYVWVKAGSSGHLYGYPDGTESGTGLTSPATDSISHITFYYCEEPGVEIVKTAGPTSISEAGVVVTYTYEVTNTGNVTLTGIVVDDDKLGGITLDHTELDPGESTSSTATYEVTQADIDAGDDIVNVATVTTDEGVEDDDDATVGIVQDASIAITKTAYPQEYEEAGDEITYTFTVTNTGNVTLTNVSVSDPLDGLSEITPTSVDLEPNESQQFTATYTVTEDDISAGQIENEATATGTDPDDGTVSDTDDETVTYEPDPAPAVSLEKTASPTNVSEPGTVTYTYTVENTGNVTLTGIEIHDDQLGEIDLSATQLAPEESANGTATYDVTQDDIDEGLDIVNEAEVTTKEDAVDSDTATVVIVQSPDIHITKTADPTQVSEAGTEVTYTFTVTNTGNVTLEDITVEDDKLGAITVSPTTLAPTASTSSTGSYQVTQEDLDVKDSIVNVATATGYIVGEYYVEPNGAVSYEYQERPSVSDTASATVNLVTEPDPDEYVLTLVADPDAGGTVDGAGEYAAETVVSISAQANEGWEFINWTDEENVEVSDEAEFEYTMPERNVTLTANFEEEEEDDPSPRPTRYYNLTLNVSPEGAGVATANPDRNRYARGTEVDLSAEANEGYEFSHWVVHGTETEDAETNVTMNGNRTATAYFVAVVEPEEPEAEPEPAISLSKTADVDSVEPGGTIIYTLVVENTGNTDLTSVRLSDSLFGSGWGETIAVLEPGESVSFEEVYEVAADFDAEQIVNIARVVAREGVTDEATASVSVETVEEIEPVEPEAPLPHTGGNALLYVLLGSGLLTSGWILRRSRK